MSQLWRDEREATRQEFNAPDQVGFILNELNDSEPLHAPEDDNDLVFGSYFCVDDLSQCPNLKAVKGLVGLLRALLQCHSQSSVATQAFFQQFPLVLFKNRHWNFCTREQNCFQKQQGHFLPEHIYHLQLRLTSLKRVT
jgi:hypothetical protein